MLFRKRWQKVIFVLVKVYIVLCTLLFVFQRNIQYSPPAKEMLGLKADKSFTQSDSENIKRIHLAAGTHTLSGYVVNPGKQKALMYFGGTAESVELNAPFFASQLPEVTVYLMPYRGFSGNPGEPSEQAIFEDALTLYDTFSPRHRRVKVMGRSMGTSVATYVAANRSVEKVVLVTPFYSMLALAKAKFPMFPIALIMKDTYETWSFAGNVSAPIQVLLAEYDNVVPHQSSYRLFQEFHTELEFKIIKQANHNSIALYPQYRQALLAVLRE